MAACCILLFALFGVKSLAGMVVVGLLFGFFSGACKLVMLVPTMDFLLTRMSDISLIPPLLARMCRDMSELG